MPKRIRHGRRTPYTSRGITRLPCFRCGNPAVYQWSICSDGNLYRPVCVDCDIAINRLILRFMRFPDWQRKADEYEQAQREARDALRQG